MAVISFQSDLPSEYASPPHEPTRHSQIVTLSKFLTPFTPYVRSSIKIRMAPEMHCLTYEKEY